MQKNKLQVAILKTLAFFDIFNYPLTSLEVWRYLYQPAEEGRENFSLDDVTACLNSLENVRTHEGFYFLATRDEKIVLARKEKYNIAEEKFRKVKKIGKFLALLSFVRAIFVFGSLSQGVASDNSDIDLFIITKKGKVWTARFLCLTFLKIFGLRPKGKNTKNKFCLSFFVDEDNLDLSFNLLPRNDICSVYWVEQFYPVYDSVDYYARFRAANGWLKNFLPNSLAIEPNLRRVIKLGWLSRLIKQLKEAVDNTNFLENFLKKWQLKILPQNLKVLANKNTSVIIKPGVIKLMASDKREGYRNEWVVKANDLVASS